MLPHLQPHAVGKMHTALWELGWDSLALESVPCSEYHPTQKWARCCLRIPPQQTRTKLEPRCLLQEPEGHLSPCSRFACFAPAAYTNRDCKHFQMTMSQLQSLGQFAISCFLLLFPSQARLYHRKGYRGDGTETRTKQRWSRAYRWVTTQRWTPPLMVSLLPEATCL